ncbi:THO complex subunit 4A isoform X2 [Physcomitrium patens]|uniref:RRM domain-containing protein n=1 Tax=Physcomitrium patens TaxID=3218 RepID=A0A7I4CN34_PHYPA|nr:THO complex subunit 4A-like isoform X2 [Physcomitrium patens]|eukprot:XP_024365630.1 THO complex subunit 4A-like isoform X2 [Physcomitrella patens]
MTSALDMSLDDLIKSNKTATHGGRGGGRGAAAPVPRRVGATAAAEEGYPDSRMSGPARRQVTRATVRPTPYATAKPVRRAMDSPWQHDMYENFAPAPSASVRGTGGNIETGTKLYISNLDHGVSNDDIKELFGEVGDLKRCSINYDRSGRSKGTAEVVFTRKPDAVNAMRRYNNVQLDGKPMKIEMIGTNLVAAPVPAIRSSGAMASLAARARHLSSTSALRGRGGGRSAGGVGGRGERRSGPAVEKSAEDLDAELESYHAEAMQTN